MTGCFGRMTKCCEFFGHQPGSDPGDHPEGGFAGNANARWKRLKTKQIRLR